MENKQGYTQTTDYELNKISEKILGSGPELRIIQKGAINHRVFVIRDPVFAWSSYACNGHGVKTDLQTPHPLYLVLGKAEDVKLEKQSGGERMLGMGMGILILILINVTLTLIIPI